MVKTCSKCGENEPREGQKYCNPCHAEWMRINRPKHSELNEEQKKKANARAYTNVYINRGLIERKPCYECGAIKVEAHHPDYDKPLEVVWLCKTCHVEHHKKNNNMKKINSILISLIVVWAAFEIFNSTFFIH